MNRQNITERNNEFFSYLYKLDKRWKEYDEKDVSRAATNVRTTVRARADNVFRVVPTDYVTGMWKNVLPLFSSSSPC
jgi:phage antirepressor YoqD-like protein